jgi:2-polyprenyl-3-methyl-5-hydroxy-6-metoxy-1,4-benzoquinol methylase
MIAQCPICEKDHTLVHTFTLPDYTIYTCKSCLVRLTQPFVDNKEVYDSGFIKTKKRYLDTVAMNAESHRELSPFFNITGKKILDIGCGTGSFLSTLRDSNEVVGLEISEAYRAPLESQGIPHMIGDLEENLAKVSDDYFDLITLWDVLEHLQDPNRILGIIKNKLAFPGWIIIWTNNYADCISYFAETVYRISFGKLNALIAMSFNRAGGHNYNFVGRSLEGLYRKNSLRIIKSVITDTPSEKLTDDLFFKGILELFYSANRLLGLGKIICHVLKRNET